MKNPSHQIANLMQHAVDNSEDRPPLKRPIGSEHLGQCEDCRGNVRLIKFDDGSEKETGCRCEAKRYANDKQRAINAKSYEKASALHGDYAEKTFNDYRAADQAQARALKLSKRYAEAFDEMLKKKQNLYFQGRPGTGKTHLAAAIRKVVRDQNYKVLFLSLPDYLGKVKAEFDNANTTYPIYKMAVDAELLILDDVGANRMTDWEVSEIFRLVDARNGKCTIYTTNLKSSDMTASIGLSRIFSRMMANTETIVLNGDDYRIGGPE
ncbi:ATP-binding protein [Salinicoccus sesuvii]|uniref:ATP-binding protein n=1 Tax=Salinicoccus sesuvii TaxID=868281 RepID=A0ABV7N4W3_9STAP